MTQALEPRGGLIIATFAEDGPEYWSGLPVAPYSAAQLAAFIGPDFTLADTRTEIHTTPDGTIQPFTLDRSQTETIPG